MSASLFPSKAPARISGQQARAAKQVQIDALKERFSRATSAVLLQFRGLSVAKTGVLRNQFRAAGVEFHVVKNSLVKIAIKDTKLDTDEFKKVLAGETAIAWTYEDPSVAAKLVKEFRKDDVIAQKVTIKCGVLENQVMPADRVESVLATLPGKDEVRAMLLAQPLVPRPDRARRRRGPARWGCRVRHAVLDG